MEFHSLLMEFHSFVLVLLITNVIKVRMLIKIQKLEGQKKEMRRTTTTTHLGKGVSIFNVRRNLVVQVKCLCHASSNSQNTRYANVHVHKLLFKKKEEWCIVLCSHMYPQYNRVCKCMQGCQFVTYVKRIFPMQIALGISFMYRH